MRRCIWKSYLLIAIGSNGSRLLADQFHYHNMVVGERAMGLGGAFCAVADDASGLIYNPAGIAFALSNDITGSANAFYRKTATYKEAIGRRDFIEHSSGTLAPFFGGLQKTDEWLPGSAVAFGLFTIDSELKDQDDLITDVGNLERFHRTANVRSATTGFGVAGAMRVFPQWSVGMSLSYIMIDELIQDYQDVQYKTGVFLTQNFRTQLESGGVELGLGTQYGIGAWSFGIHVRTRSLLSDSYQVGLDLRTNNNGSGGAGENRRTQTQIKVEDALGALPTEVRVGTAWFPSAAFLWTFDIIHNTAATSDSLTLFNREAVTNFASGAEYYITPSIPVRTGIFTNYDTRPELETGKLNQQDHIDYVGYTLFFGWVQPNSQIAVGVIAQSGEGKAQKVQGPAIQTVEAEAYTFAISATHSF